MLIGFVVVYLLASIAIGLYAATRVKTSTDYVVAGRSLPLYIIIATTFATWFGAETVLGISAKFIEGGLHSVVEDPFGSSLCLVFVGLFFAAKLYKMNLVTIGDYYRERYGKTVEIVTSIAIVLSYLGWVAAQIKALGLVFHMLAPDTISQETGMWIGTSIVLLYTLFGGMWSVALTDFFQMIVISVGLIVIAYFAVELAGGADKVIATAQNKDMFRFWPETSMKEIAFFIGAWVTMMLGSIPQQDVFQRVMSAKDADTARRGPIIGGTLYFLFAFIPMFIAVAALTATPEITAKLISEDSQKVLPTFILNNMPVIAQVFFFGALLSAIMSTASATLLAPSTAFTENILRNLKPHMSDQQFLRYLRITVLIFTACVLTFALNTTDSIYEMVGNAYKVTLVGAFVPLVMGLYWRRASTQGAILSIVFGLTVWILGEFLFAEDFPPQLAGLLAAFAGMLLGSLLPQWQRPQHAHAHHLPKT